MQKILILETTESQKITMLLKFMFSKKAKKIDEIFTVDLTFCNMCQIDGEDSIKFCGLFRKSICNIAM